MRRNAIRTWVMLAAILLLPLLALMAQQTSLLLIDGQQGQARVIQVQGKNYVEVDGLARITGGSLRFIENQIILTLPGSDDTSSQAAQSAPASSALIAFSLGCPYLFAQQGPPAHLGQTQLPSSDTEKPADKTEALQKTTENTVASIMSVPIEHKSNFDMGPYGRNQYIVNIKPLIPMRMSKQWRLIARIIQPIHGSRILAAEKEASLV